MVHIELRKWADVLVIAPLSANTLGKMANGICDNLVTSVFRAWNVKEKPVIIAPAMNTLMWNSPFTEQHLETLQSLFNGGTSKLHLIEPISKKLMCNDVGKGAMATPNTIAQTTVNVLLQQNEPLSIRMTQDHRSTLLVMGIVMISLFLYGARRSR